MHNNPKRDQRILLVDDDELFLGSTRRYLQRAGYHVSVAADGNEAINSINSQPVDLVITDIFMPRKGGLETIREIRKRRPELKIIAISGGGFFAPEILLELGLRFGASRILEKPFRGSELLAALEELFPG